MPKRVLVTRASEDARLFSYLLRNAGFEPVEVPTIERGWRVVALADALSAGTPPDWILLTSATAVDVLAAAYPHIPETTRLAAIGTTTARRAQDVGFTINLIPATFTRDELIRSLGDVRGKSIVYPRADLAPSTLKDALQAAGAQVTDIVAYTNHAPKQYELPLLDALPVDATTLFSGSAAHRVASAVPLERRAQLGKVLAIGPSTAREASKAGLEVGAVATPHTVAGMVELTRKIFNQDERDPTS